MIGCSRQGRQVGLQLRQAAILPQAPFEQAIVVELRLHAIDRGTHIARHR